MRAGYFCLQPKWTTHFVHDLELIEADLEQGNEVHVVSPGRLMRFCDTAAWEDYGKRLASDLRRFRRGISMLSGKVTVHSLDKLVRGSALFPQLESMEWPEFDTQESLNEFRFESLDCGNAVLSSLISHTHNVGAVPTEYQEWVRDALDTSIKVYLAAQRFIEVCRPDRVYLFNGRMATFRGVLRACQDAGVECMVHERGATLKRIGLALNTMPHDIDWIQKEIVRHWNESEVSEEEKCQIGRSFYELTRNRHVFSWYSFTEQQEANRLPQGIDRQRRVYSIFTSSEGERFALPQYYRYLLHDSQMEGILDIIRILKEKQFDGTLCIRIHPNSHEERPDLLAGLRREVQEDFVRIIPADSPVDTYALIDASDKVFTFGSTVGVEAAFWGKPSVSFATSGHQALDALYHPVDREDARRLITEDLEAKDAQDCLKFGFYYSTFGRKLRYSEVVDVGGLTFKGQTIRKNPFYQRLGRRCREFMRHLIVKKHVVSVEQPGEASAGVRAGVADSQSGEGD